MKKIAYFLLLISYCLFFTHSVNASYVLPYPSYMPGNKLYRVSRLLDQVKKFWYFGNISQIKYHLGLADKYLVEAKTLFEYKQYFLGVDALQRSDMEFQQLTIFVAKAEKEQKDIKNFKTLITEAAKKHVDVLSNLQLIIPAEFTWSPEKDMPTDLKLFDELRASQSIRSQIVTEILSL